MKKFKTIGIAIAGVCLFAGIVMSGPVTQTATAVAKNLPPSTRIEKMNNGIADVTTTDLPAIIAELNSISTAAMFKVTFATNTIVYLNASSNITTSTWVYVSNVTTNR